MHKDKEKNEAPSHKTAVLDWKLDFYDAELGRLYDDKFNETFINPYKYV